jgi:hypothetical protein
LNRNEDNSFPVRGGKVHQCCADFVAIGQKAIARLIGGSLFAMLLKSCLLACSLPRPASMNVADDLQQPGSEARRVAQRCAVLPGRKQGALDNVIGMVSTPAQHAGIGAQEGDLGSQLFSRKVCRRAHRF